MFKIIGSVIVIASSFCTGYFFSENMKNRLRAVKELHEFINYISVNIEMYNTPLSDVYETFKSDYLYKCGFIDKLHMGIYTAAKECGLLMGDEENEIIYSFDEKIGRGNTEDMVKLCSYSVSKLKNIADKIACELPEKRRVYRTISLLVGISTVIILL